MADSAHLVPFLFAAEGGYVDNPNDSGGSTMKGITYAEWCVCFGNNAHDRFMAMSVDDWTLVFKNAYWAKIYGDQINSQLIADITVDWLWNSGYELPEANVQTILNTQFGDHIGIDGVFGAQTIASINATPEKALFDDIADARSDFFINIVKTTPSQLTFLKGWEHRLLHILYFEYTGVVIT